MARGRESSSSADHGLGFVRDEGAKISADGAVPCGIVFLVKLVLYVESYVFLNVVFVKRR